jgi:hypothetical protein
VSGNEEAKRFGLGIPTFGFVEQLDEFLGSLNKKQLIMQLEEFGFVKQAENSRLEKIKESDVRGLLYMSYSRLISEKSFERKA